LSRGGFGWREREGGGMGKVGGIRRNGVARSRAGGVGERGKDRGGLPGVIGLLMGWTGGSNRGRKRDGGRWGSGAV